MTVCIVAIFENQFIVGASDRMLTAGDIQFQPSQSKVWPLTTSITGMIAGDVGIHADIFNKINSDISIHLENNPQQWLKVSDVAELYVQYYEQLKIKCSERDILKPLGLDRNKFIELQANMQPNLVELIANNMYKYQIPNSGVIFTGIDNFGPHIYVVENGKIRCEDKVGFAAIGAGYWHADSHLMFSGHTKASPLYKALQATYFAKKRAEVAPGVGVDTDMFAITGLGAFTSIKDDIIKGLGDIYCGYLKTIRRADRHTDGKMNQYVQKILEIKPDVQQITDVISA